MIAVLAKLWANDDAATAIEDGLIAALISVAPITSTFQSVATQL